MSASAVAIFALVIGISDGDTLTVLRDHQQTKVRLAEIDAPEKKQPFGARAKQSLSDLCFGKQAEVTPQAKDRYGRTIARVSCDGNDASAHQVRTGMAWVYVKYAQKYSPLYSYQEEARAARRGLWADSSPIPPWEWRDRAKGR